MGPGRVGTKTDVQTGPPITFADLFNTAVLIEMSWPSLRFQSELSAGTHFYNDLIEKGIRRLGLYPEEAGNVFNTRYFREAPNSVCEFGTDFSSVEHIVKVIDVRKASGGKTLSVYMNAEQDKALAILE